MYSYTCSPVMVLYTVILLQWSIVTRFKWVLAWAWSRILFVAVFALKRMLSWGHPRQLTKLVRLYVKILTCNNILLASHVWATTEPPKMCVLQMPHWIPLCEMPLLLGASQLHGSANFQSGCHLYARLALLAYAAKLFFFLITVLLMVRSFHFVPVFFRFASVIKVPWNDRLTKRKRPKRAWKFYRPLLQVDTQVYIISLHVNKFTLVPFWNFSYVFRDTGTIND